MAVSNGSGIKTKTYYDDLGNIVTLILDPSSMKQGGEGYIADIKGRPNLIAKIYVDKPSLDGKPIPQAEKLEKFNKLKYMCNLYDDKLSSYSAFPKKVLFDSRGKIVGFVMDKITDAKKINMLYSYRKKEFPFADWGFMVHAAKNLAIAVNTLHDKNIVIGDINPGNILVDNHAMIKLIDCDSYQVDDNGHLYYCNVGVPEYTPLELQRKSFRGTTRTKNHDSFGLAVMIFQILFFSKHPYSGPGVSLEVIELVEKGQYCYGRNSSIKSYHAKLVNALLTDELKDLFEKAFSRSKNIVRPTPKEWEIALDNLEKNLQTCSCGHKYNKQASSCIWCDIKNQKNGGYDFFGNENVRKKPSKQTPYYANPQPTNYTKPKPISNSQNISSSSTSSSNNAFRTQTSEQQLIWFIVAVFTTAIVASVINLRDPIPTEYPPVNNSSQITNPYTEQRSSYSETVQKTSPKPVQPKVEVKQTPTPKPTETKNNTKQISTSKKQNTQANQVVTTNKTVKTPTETKRNTPVPKTTSAKPQQEPIPVKKVKTDLEQSSDYFFE